jgi:hypothetical protein
MSDEHTRAQDELDANDADWFEHQHEQGYHDTEVNLDCCVCLREVETALEDGKVDLAALESATAPTDTAATTATTGTALEQLEGTMPMPDSFAALGALNKKLGNNIYAGPANENKFQRQRAKNKVARKRRVNNLRRRGK